MTIKNNNQVNQRVLKMYRYKLFIKQHWFEILLIIAGVMLVIWAGMQYAEAVNQLNIIKGEM